MGKTHRGTRGGSRRRSGRADGAFNQAVAENVLEAGEYSEWIVALALMRYEWHGLPATCDARFLEQSLVMTGHASIAPVPDSGVWMSLRAASYGELNAYGNPERWQCMGQNGRVYYESDWTRGVFLYDRESRASMWGKLYALAKKLARYSRTESVNLLHQFTPFLITAPEEQVQSVQNVLAQTLAGQSAVVGFDSLSEMVRNGVSAIDTRVEWKGDKLQSGALGCWGEVFRILGIPHLAFEKRERLITDEAQTTLIPTRLMLDDGLRARKRACEQLQAFGFQDADVSINPIITDAYETMRVQEVSENVA